MSITDTGAVPDNHTLCTHAIQRAIDRVSAHGGGLVRVPAGAYLTGTVNLTSNVYLYLEAGGVLQGTANPLDYAWDWDYWHIVQGLNSSNTGVIGPRHLPLGSGGEIRGPMWQMIDHWDPKTSSFVQREWTGHAGCVGECRPKNLAFIDATNVTVAGVRLTHSADWTQLYRRCRNVLNERVWVEGALQWGNNDGLDVESGYNVTIRDGYLKTGDDCLAFRSGNCNKLRTPWPPGPLPPISHVRVSNMHLISTSSAVKTEALFESNHGDLFDFVFRNLTVRSSNRGVGVWQRDGNGTIRDLLFEDLDMETVFQTEPQFWGSGEPIVLTTLPSNALARRQGLKGLHNITFRRVRARAENGVMVAARCTLPDGDGARRLPLSGLRFEDVNITLARLHNVSRAVRDFRPAGTACCGDMESARINGIYLEGTGAAIRDNIIMDGVRVRFHPPYQSTWTRKCVAVNNSAYQEVGAGLVCFNGTA